MYSFNTLEKYTDNSRSSGFFLRAIECVTGDTFNNYEGFTIQNKVIMIQVVIPASQLLDPWSPDRMEVKQGAILIKDNNFWIQ